MGADVDHPAHVNDTCITMFDCVVAFLVGPVLVGVRLEAGGAHVELAVRQLFGVVEQHWRKLGQAITYPPVLPHRREPGGLGDSESAGKPCIAETADVVDRPGETPQSGRFEEEQLIVARK